MCRCRISPTEMIECKGVTEEVWVARSFLTCMWPYIATGWTGPAFLGIA